MIYTDWKHAVDAAKVDLNSALTGHPSRAMDSLLAAKANIEAAIEALEDSPDEEP